MDLPALLHTYGYALIFVGTLAEGESLLALGGYFAHRGYLEIVPVIVTAFCGAVCGDQLFFYIGRHHAKRLLAHFPKMRDKVNLALAKIENHQIKVVLGMRFMWGLRIALPMALGLTNMPLRRFVWLNLVSAAVWSCVFALIGYGVGNVITRFFSDMKLYERWIAFGVLAAAAIALAWAFGRPRRSASPEPPK